MNIDTQMGYFALTTVIILSVILVMVATGLSLGTYFNSFNVLNYEIREQAYLLSYSCIDVAKYRLDNDLDYEGNEIVQINSEYSCKILPITYDGFDTFVTTVASTSDSFARLEATFDELLNMTEFKQIF